MKKLALIIVLLLSLNIVYAEELSLDKNLFADNGEGKATVVVGINHQGIVPEDLKCANDIAEKLKDVGTGSVTLDDDMDLEITWLTDTFTPIEWSNINESSFYRKSTTGKAEFKYSYIYFTEKSSDLKFRPSYQKTSAAEGEIFSVRYYDWRISGMTTDYYGIVDLEADDKIEVGAVTKMTFSTTSDKNSFILVPQTTKTMGVSSIIGNVSVTMGVYDNNIGALDGIFALPYNESTLPQLIEEKEFLDIFPDYHMIIETVDFSEGTVTIAYVNKSETFVLTDGAEDIAGYEFVKVFNDDYDVANGFAGFGPEEVLSIGEKVNIGGTKYWLTLSQSKSLDIEKETTENDIMSDTWLRYTKPDYEDFLTKDIMIEASTSYSSIPHIPVTSEKYVTDTEKAGKTLVLLGGPVANSLVAELVTANRSKVDWYSSTGEIEVIENAFVDGQTAIIVAGKDREATKVAAEMFTTATFTAEEVSSSGWG